MSYIVTIGREGETQTRVILPQERDVLFTLDWCLGTGRACFVIQDNYAAVGEVERDADEVNRAIDIITAVNDHMRLGGGLW